MGPGHSHALTAAATTRDFMIGTALPRLGVSLAEAGYGAAA